MYTKQDIVTVAAPIDSRIAKVVTIKSENDEIVVKIENVSIKDVVFCDKAWGFVVETTRVIYRKPLTLNTFREVLRSQPTEVTTIETKIFESSEIQNAMRYYHGSYDKNAPSECMNRVNKILK